MSDIHGLISSGLLHEMNRRILHPAGFALVASGAGLALREGEGFFLDGNLSPDKAANVEQLIADLAEKRREKFGWSVQPCKGETGIPLTLDTSDLSVDFLMRLAEDFARGLGEADDALREALFEKLLLTFIPRLLSGFRVTTSGGVVFAPRPIPSGRNVLSPQQLGRAFWLARELPRLAKRHEVQGGLDAQGRAIVAETETQLFPEEVEKALAVSARVLDTWNFPANLPRNAPEDLRLMEELFSLAQPGMLFWRGGRPDIKLGSPSIKAELAKWRFGRDELGRFLAGEIPASDLADPSKAKAEIEERLAPLEERLAELDAERRTLFSSAAPLRSALERLEE